jgi:HK97 family phage portal protein
MGIFERWRERVRGAIRAFVLGQGVVLEADRRYGHDPTTFAPESYGVYLATSNPVYACATLRAQLLAALPLRFYKVRRGGEAEEVTSGGLVEVMRRVNPFWTMGRLLRMTELSLCLWGSAYWFCERGKSGRIAPREIWWGRPDRVRVIPDRENYVAGFLYEPANGMEPIRFEPGEVVWFRLDNPVDEYSGLAPLAAARLAADTRSAALKSNRNLFAQGMQMGGAVMPTNGVVWDQDQADDLGDRLDQRFKGVDKAHRWGVFRMEVKMQQAGVTPKDAEFLGLAALTLEDACRAYKIPLDIMGGQRSYQNINAALRMLYDFCIVPESTFIAEELTEFLLPMFGREADEAAFDLDGVIVLQEDANEQWNREQGQLTSGVMTINEWREDKGLDVVEWGDVWWAPMGVTAVRDGEEAGSKGQEGEGGTEGTEGEEGEVDADETDEEGNASRGLAGAVDIRMVEYGGLEHQRLWNRYVGRVGPQEAELGEVVAGLFRRLQTSILDRLLGRGTQAQFERSIEDVLLEPFNRSRWERTFREETRPVIEVILRFHAVAALADLGLEEGVLFEILPHVIRFLEGRAQRFAREILDTTWTALKGSLNEGILAGETIQQLEVRVRDIMGERIASSSEVIARTEVVGASNGGILEAWRQSGVVAEKIWISALIPGRTRESHFAAHGQTVPLDADFLVGGGSGPAPGQIGLAGEDINCLCTMSAVVRGAE